MNYQMYGHGLMSQLTHNLQKKKVLMIDIEKLT